MSAALSSPLVVRSLDPRNPRAFALLPFAMVELCCCCFLAPSRSRPAGPARYARSPPGAGVAPVLERRVPALGAARGALAPLRVRQPGPHEDGCLRDRAGRVGPLRPRLRVVGGVRRLDLHYLADAYSYL